MMDKAVLAKMGALWKQYRDPDLLRNPMAHVGMFKDLEEVSQAIDASVSPFEVLSKAPADQSIADAREEMRELQLTQYMTWRLLRRFGFGNCPTGQLLQANIGGTHVFFGDYEAASHYLDRVVPAMRESYAPDDSSYLSAVFSWAQCCMARGCMLEALETIEDIVTRAQQAGCQAEILRKLTELVGLMYAGFGRYDRARKLLQEAQDFCVSQYGRESSMTIAAMMRLANAVEMPTGNLERATRLLSEALFALESNRGVYWAEMVLDEVYCLAAQIEGMSGDSEKQIHYLIEAFESAKRFSNVRDPNVVAIVLQLAGVLCETGQHADALEALKLLDADEDLEWMAPGHLRQFLDILYSSGTELEMELPVGRMQRAATESLVREVRQIFSWSDEPLALRCSQELWNSIGALLAMVLKYMDEQDADLTAELFCLVVEFKGIVAESLCLARERRFAVLYPQYRKDLEHLAGLRRQLQGTFREVFRGIPDNAEERLANHLRAQKRELEETLRKGIPELRPQPPSVPELARALDDLDKDSVLIDLTRLPSDSHLDGWAVFILPAGSPGCLRMIELSAGPAISEALVIFVKSLLAEADSCAPAPDYQPLWTLLWSPIETVLAELRITLPDRKLSRLFVSQDGILNCLPFQVLRNPQWEEGRYLIDEYEITYLTTARDLFNLPDIGAHPGRRPLALGLCNFSGDPSQASPRGKGVLFSQLRNAEDDARWVGQKLGGDVLTGYREVTKEKVEANLGHINRGETDDAYHSPIVLHIASHGFCLATDSKDQPRQLQEAPDAAVIQDALLRSGLALSGAEDSARTLLDPEPIAELLPGILSAYEISGLDLRDTELVFLSACQSGLGTISLGEGIFGLQRAFHIAGARTLVMTLWSVKEEAATLLTEAFYSRLRLGDSRSAALCYAQMQLRRKLRWPAIWGGFVCQGNPLPIRGIVENSRIDLADYSVKQREVPAAPALIPVPLTSDTHEEMHAAQPLAHYSSQLQDDALRKAFALMNGSSPITPDEIRNTRRILYVLLREFRNLGCDDSEWAACAKVCIGITHCESGNHADALHYLNPGLSILRNARRPTDDTYLVGMLAWATACQALDQGAETIPVLESTIADAREAGCKSEPLQRLEAFLAAAYRKPLGISHTQANNSESKKGVS